MDFWYGENVTVRSADGVMMKKYVVLMLLGLMKGTFAATPSIQVFISFSMPDQLLKQTLNESSRLHIPAIINGLYRDSMPETAKKILALTKMVPELNLQIDPIAFDRFGIKQVPALVVSGAHGFDVIYGNLALKDGLYRIADSTNDSGLSRADLRRIFGE